MDEHEPDHPPAEPVTIEHAMAAFAQAEAAIVTFGAIAADLAHEEASGLRGLAATVLAELRAGKPGGAK